jgi:hypothetical protein
MPQRSTAIRIPQPCAESWAAMTPTATGRHCTACQKTVVDFTQKTDAEILAVLRLTAGETCGRLRADQVDRPLVAPAPAPRWRTWLGATLAAGSMLSGAKATAQANLGHHNGGPVPMANATSGSPTVAPPSSTKPAEPAPDQAGPGGPLEPIVLRGSVTDSATHEGLPGVTVLLASTTTGTATDATGAFALPVAADATSVQLLFSSVGYVGQHLTVSTTSSQPIAVSMQGAVMGGLVSGVVVVSGVGPRPFPWHPRRFFNWSKYWLTQPFRH